MSDKFTPPSPPPSQCGPVRKSRQKAHKATAGTLAYDHRASFTKRHSQLDTVQSRAAEDPRNQTLVISTPWQGEREVPRIIPDRTHTRSPSLFLLPPLLSPSSARQLRSARPGIAAQESFALHRTPFGPGQPASTMRSKCTE